MPLGHLLPSAPTAAGGQGRPERLPESGPDFAWLYLLRGFASGQVGAIFAQAGGVAAQPSNLQGKAEDHFVAAEEDYAKALELLERKPVAELRYVLLVNRGLLRWQRRDLDRAVTDLREAIRFDPRLYQAHAGLAQVHRQQGKPDEAVEQFTQAIALRPDLAPLYRGRAEVYRGHEDLTPARIEAALRDLDEAVRRESPANPVLALDHTNRARLLDAPAVTRKHSLPATPRCGPCPTTPTPTACASGCF